MSTLRFGSVGAAAVIGAVALGVASPVARADETSYVERPFDRPRTQFGFGMYVGGFGVGPISGTAAGAHFDVGRQMGSLLLMGEYDLLSIGESGYEIDDPIRGVMHRVGVAARYNVGEVGSGKRVPLQGAFWLEAALGREMIRWHGGGKLSRDDVGFGVGSQMNIRSKTGEDQRVWTLYYAFRGIIAESPDAAEIAMMEPSCAGPCDEPTTPSKYDMGLFFNVGFSWGR